MIKYSFYLDDFNVSNLEDFSILYGVDLELLLNILLKYAFDNIDDELMQEYIYN